MVSAVTCAVSTSLSPVSPSSGNSTETATVDENTHEFFTELTEPGTYRVQVSTLSSAGDCEARESTAYTGLTFYLSMYSLTLTLTLTLTQTLTLTLNQTLNHNTPTPPTTATTTRRTP